MTVTVLEETLDKIGTNRTFICQCSNCKFTFKRTLSSINRVKVLKCPDCMKGRGGSKHESTYQSYKNMIQRCTNSNYPHYHNYGGRSIIVCEKWLNSFMAFIEDMGERPENMTLDRIDVNGDYNKENCRWATQSTQIRNRGKTKSKYSDYRGVSYDKNRESWVAYIHNCNKTYNLGRFLTELDAAEAYNLECLEFNHDSIYWNRRF